MLGSIEVNYEFLPCFENPTTIDNISKQIQSGPGVVVFWGPPDSGKPSYAVRVCNKLLEENKIGGVVQVSDSTFEEVKGDGGVGWINTALNADNLMGLNERISSLIPCNGPDDSLYEQFMSFVFRRNKRVVILFNQFDNVCEHSSIKMVLTFIKRLAEDSVKHDSYTVFLCVTNPLIARDILNLNGGEKFRLLQKPRDLKWGDNELTKYFKGNPYSKSAQLAGTPGFCVDILRRRIDNPEQTSARIEKEWSGVDFLEGLM